MTALLVKVIPNAQKNQITGFNANGELKVRLNAAPEKGKANEELINYMSEVFSIKKQSISIINGLTSRKKTLEISGYNAERLNTLLAIEAQKFGGYNV